MAPSLLGNQQVRKQRIGKSNHASGRAYWRTGPDSSLSGGRQVSAQRRNGGYVGSFGAGFQPLAERSPMTNCLERTWFVRHPNKAMMPKTDREESIPSMQRTALCAAAVAER